KDRDGFGNGEVELILRLLLYILLGEDVLAVVTGKELSIRKESTVVLIQRDSPVPLRSQQGRLDHPILDGEWVRWVEKILNRENATHELGVIKSIAFGAGVAVAPVIILRIVQIGVRRAGELVDCSFVLAMTPIRSIFHVMRNRSVLSEVHHHSE